MYISDHGWLGSSPVIERLLHSEPLLRVDGEHLSDEVLGVVADVLPPAGAQVQPALADGVVQPVLGAEEGHRAREEDVQEDPGRPHVHRLPVRPPLYHLC